MSAPVDVAVAVLLRDDGRVLLARRPEGKVYSGYWEFPGGKVEPGERVEDALQREIREELAIDIELAYPWITQVFSYPHATVRLHFYRVLGWKGEPHATEHEALAWERPESVSVAPLLPANGPVLKALALPAEYAISQAGDLGADAFLARLRTRLAQGLKLVQLREPALTRIELAGLAARVLSLARPAGARVLISRDAELARELGADGVHLSAQQVASAAVRPDLPLVGASSHSAVELRAAERLGADFAVLGPVCSTPSHPERAPIGWEGFRSAASGAAIPVFALGGVAPADLRDAWRRAAHGVAMVRAAWRV